MASSVQASWRFRRLLRAAVKLPQTTTPEVSALGESRRGSGTDVSLTSPSSVHMIFIITVTDCIHLTGIYRLRFAVP
jgi:hypothetical protein